jgi:hypothetical protein
LASGIAVGSFSGDVSLSSAGAESKTLAVSGTVSAATITLTADAKSKTYGDADPALTYSSSGLVGSDSLSGSLLRAFGENVGVYAITQGTLDAGGNYTISFTGANFTITPKALTSSDITLTRNEDNSFSASAAGAAGFTYSYSGRDGTNYGPTAASPTDPGAYTVTATVNDPNFTGSKSEEFTIESTDHPAFRITSITMNGTLCTLTWESQPGASYAVEATGNLADSQSWSPIRSDISSQGTTSTLTIDIADTTHVGSPRLFLRVRAE